MFGKLKEKFTSWLKKPEKKQKEPAEAPKPKTKKVKQQKHKSTPKEEIIKKKQLEDIPSEQPKETTEEKPTFFTKLKQKLISSKLTQNQFDELFEELEITLLENNVALEVVDKIKSSLSKELVDKDIDKSKVDKIILQALKDSIDDILIEPPNLIQEIKSSTTPYVILFFGINGSGKTTSIAKLAYLLKKSKLSCVLVAGDTFRAASIEQLETHANKLKVPIVKSQYNADPSSVAFDAISYAKKHKINAVLIDTAGRMYTKSNLIREMEKIVRVSKPNLKIFVGESITGNDATNQAKTFNEAIGIDGIILSKADVDEKAGTILSVSHITNKPIYFLGTGQSYDNLTPFTKSTIFKNLGLEN